MNSINQNQPEENHENLSGDEAIAKIKELADKATCFFCTNIKTGSPFSARPMSVQQIDEEGNLWFFISNDSKTYAELTADPSLQLLFQRSQHSDLLDINGTAHVIDDKAKIKELWEPLLKTWFTEGENDPRIALIKVEPHEGYYWDNKHGNAIAFVKMTVGALIGKTLDDSIEGVLKV